MGWCAYSLLLLLPVACCCLLLWLHHSAHRRAVFALHFIAMVVRAALETCPFPGFLELRLAGRNGAAAHARWSDRGGTNPGHDTLAYERGIKRRGEGGLYDTFAKRARKPGNNLFLTHQTPPSLCAFQ